MEIREEFLEEMHDVQNLNLLLDENSPSLKYVIILVAYLTIKIVEEPDLA